MYQDLDIRPIKTHVNNVGVIRSRWVELRNSHYQHRMFNLRHITGVARRLGDLFEPSLAHDVRNTHGLKKCE